MQKTFKGKTAIVSHLKALLNLIILFKRLLYEVSLTTDQEGIEVLKPFFFLIQEEAHLTI